MSTVTFSDLEPRHSEIYLCGLCHEVSGMEFALLLGNANHYRSEALAHTPNNIRSVV